ncbi:MAG: helix-turn-helix transcriptional regulator [Bacteroidia bacterium]|nr:helix-turn-helix transcriptional regulator [Bacteroidia bacterium]
MNLAEQIRLIRKSKGLSQKEVALNLEMDQSQYSRIENGRSDPYFSTIEKIAKALGVDLSELFASNTNWEVQSVDKTVMEKVHFIESLEKKEREAFYIILDAFLAKERLKNSLQSALQEID